ncbi:MAG: hypothetical protein QF747_03365, partial [Patescibacteria group bacterium]|nr:hypothetical protein [Patescibacteria group bacterium]
SKSLSLYNLELEFHQYLMYHYALQRSGEVVSREAHNLQTSVQFWPPQQEQNKNVPRGTFLFEIY